MSNGVTVLLMMLAIGMLVAMVLCVRKEKELVGFYKAIHVCGRWYAFFMANFILTGAGCVIMLPVSLILMLMGKLDAIAAQMGGTGMAFAVFALGALIVLIFALILTLFGVLNTLKNRQTEKWKGLAIHAAIWVFGYFGFKLLAILVIIVVLAAVFTRGEIFAGLANMIGSASSGSTETFRYASFYYERSDEFKEWSLYNDCGNYAVLRNTENGNMVTVYPHNNDGLVSDDTGKLYYPK